MAVVAKKKTHPWSQIKTVRKSRGLTQKDCADLVGISQGHWSQIEKGESKPSRSLAILLRLFIADRL